MLECLYGYAILNGGEKTIEIDYLEYTSHTSMHGNILLERSLPLSWTTREAGSPVSNTRHNQIIFDLLDSLEESSYQKPDTENASELIRIETKLNLVMQLLAELLQDRQSHLPEVSIRFSNDTLAWRVEQPLSAGTLLQVSLSPDDRIPLAMSFEARVLAVNDGWMEVDMHGLDEDELAKWSRWVFRQHRRQVAQTRTFPVSQVKSE